jgi:ADP-ribose pyrophosphatase YjhB (NUDIX family)
LNLEPVQIVEEGGGAILTDMEQGMLRPLVGVGVVFVRRGKVFLAKRQGSHGEATWASAGGHLEMGESLEECKRSPSKETCQRILNDVQS